ncbi:25790_t:CDS:2 [Dentiscutata erythropus]|uniref:25790_t:CDS:1 n=1 Tax=Dentiscutata erythropus TaxID=1348616 RepID=A0A9N9GPZ9_9GLOM|nr:25790_t:CDS:2 [Dentiscutata erythropus]
MPYAPSNSFNKQNEDSAPVDNQNYHGSSNCSSIKPNAVNTSRTFQQSYYFIESFSAYFPGNCIDGMPITKEPTEMAARGKKFTDGIELGFKPLNTVTNPIAIPSTSPTIRSSS